MDTLAIDFETYYDRAFSLTKIPMQEYIRSSVFEIIGVSVKHNDGHTLWFSGTLADTRTWLAQFNWANSICVAHNAQFDGAILEWIIGVKPAKYFCTMMGSRPFVTPFVGKMSLAVCAKHYALPDKGIEVQNALGKRRVDFTTEQLSRYAEYCKHDTTLSYMLYQLFQPELAGDEEDLLDLTIKKYTRPILELDREVLTDALEEEKKRREAAMDKVSSIAPSLNVNSNAQFAKALQGFGITPPMKISPTTGKQTFAFSKADPGFLDLLSCGNPAVEQLCEARLVLKSSITHTRLKKFITISNAGGSFAVPLVYCGAHTWRFSGGGGINLQNLGRGSALRHAITAPPGYEIVVGDLSQIEARIVAVLAGQMELVRQFANGEDVYSKFAERIYRKPINKKDNPDERFVGKVGILSLGYGAGHVKFGDTLKMFGHEQPLSTNQRIVHTYRDVYDDIPRLWRQADSLIPAMAEGVELTLGPIKTGRNCIILPNGKKIHYPDLLLDVDGWSFKYQGKMRKKIYGGALVENICQALAKIVLSEMELFLARRKFESVLQVHDELVYCVPESIAEKFALTLTKVMSVAPTWLPDLPVACEVERGPTYGSAK